MLVAMELAFIVGMYHPIQDNAHAAVYDVCSYSRTVNSGDWEEACGMAQDSTETEFICESIKSNARCWVENKEK